MKRLAVGDSGAITHANMKVYLVRVATLVARGADRYELGWKSPGRTVEARRIEESTPIFAEMAAPGTTFEGVWQERSISDRSRLFQASNGYAAGQIARHKEYAVQSGLARLGATLGELEARLDATARRQDACLLSIGWGAGLVGKSAYLNTKDESYRKILSQIPIYQRAIQSNLPFPKTRKVLFHGGEPASLPGWILLEVV